MPYIGNGWSHQAHDDERYHETEKLAEDAIERKETSHQRLIEHIAQQNTQNDGDDNSRQQRNFYLFHFSYDSFRND